MSGQHHDVTDAFEILNDEFSQLEEKEVGPEAVAAFRRVVSGLAELWQAIAPSADAIASGDLPDLQGQPWSWKGVMLPHGTELRVTYLPQSVEEHGKVLFGKLVFGDRSFAAPSPAVMDAIHRKTGRRQSTNGWLHIDASLNGKWVSFQSLRAQAAGRPAQR